MHAHYSTHTDNVFFKYDKEFPTWGLQCMTMTVNYQVPICFYRDRQADRQTQTERHTHTQNLHSKKRHTHTQKLHSKKHTNKDLTCSLYWFISSKDFWLLTANTQRKPSPVRMYWSRIALKQIRTTSTIPMHWCSHETWTGANVSGYKHFGLIL